MKKKKLMLPLLMLCLACFVFGVYALKNATLTTSGTVGFIAHDCTLTMYGTITGAVSNPNNMAITPNETFYFGNVDNQFQIGGEGNTDTEITFANDLTDSTLTTKYGKIYFSDAGHEVPPIVMTLNFTNTSAYPVSVTVDPIVSATGTTAQVTQAIDSINAGATATFQVTITLDNVSNDIAIGDYTETNFSLHMEFKKGLPKLDTPEATLNSEEQTMNITPVEGAKEYRIDYFDGASKVTTETVSQYQTNEYLLTNVPTITGSYDVKVLAVSDVEGVEDSEYNNTGKIDVEVVNVESSNLEFQGNNTNLGTTSNEELIDSYLLKSMGTCTDKDLVIPSTYKGKPVVGFVDLALRGTNITSVFIPKSVKKLSWSTFLECSSLTKVTFEQGINLAGMYMTSFAKCTALESITIPESVTYFDSGVFTDCTSLKRVNIPSKVTYIASDIFSGCTALEIVQLSSKVTKLYDEVFSGCYNLRTIGDTSGLTEIGNKTFYYCDKLVNIGSMENLQKIGNNAFVNCYALTSFGNASKIVSIGNSAFSGCENLETFELPETLTSLGSYAFYQCKKLAEVDIPESLTKILDSTFEGCSSLVTVTMTDKVTSIGENAFAACTALSSIYLSEGLTEISYGMLQGCNDLRDVRVPSKVTYIGDYAFAGTNSLVLLLPNGVTISDKAFFNSMNVIKQYYAVN